MQGDSTLGHTRTLLETSGFVESPNHRLEAVHVLEGAPPARRGQTHEPEELKFGSSPNFVCGAPGVSSPD